MDKPSSKCSSETFSPNGDIPEHLQQFIVTSENATAMREKIIKGLNYWKGKILPRSADVESLAQEILLEAWKTPRAVTGLFIYHRALDASRGMRNFSRLKDEFSGQVATIHGISYRQQSLSCRSSFDDRSTLNPIVKEAELSPTEFMLLYLVFDRTCTLQECAVEMKKHLSWIKRTFGDIMDKLKVAARIVAAKAEEKRSHK